MTVITLTSTILKIGFDETDSDDIDGDGTNETLAMKFELTLEKQM